MGTDHATHDHAPATEPRVRATDIAAPQQLLTPTAIAPTSRFADSSSRRLTKPQILQMQRTLGNGNVSRTIERMTSKRSPLQRHPANAPMTQDPEEARQEIANPEPLAPEGVTATPSAEPPGEAESGAEPEPTPEPAPTAEPESAATGEAPEATGDPAKPTPAPATTTVMDLATAQDVLTKSYGKSKTIVAGSIEMLADREATWKKYDEVAKGATNPHTGKAWADGDAKKYVPGLDGFASGGKVYINSQTKLATATAHEMLHNNTAADFRGKVGETINEGSTETLAIKAITAAGKSVASGTAYPGEVAFVGKLITLVSEQTLIDAYFGGAATLIDKFDKLQGAGAFAKMKPFAEAKNYTEAEKSLAPAPAPTPAPAPSPTPTPAPTGT